MANKNFQASGTKKSQLNIYYHNALDFFPHQIPKKIENTLDMDIKYANTQTCRIMVDDSKPMQFSKRIVVRVLMPSVFHAIRYRPCQLAPIDRFNPSKSNINASTNPRRRPNITINDPSRTRNPINIHPQTRNLGPGHLIRRSSSPIQNPSSRRKPCTSTYCNEIAQLGIYIPDVYYCFFNCWARDARAQATRDKKQIQRRCCCKCVGRHHALAYGVGGYRRLRCHWL